MCSKGRARQGCFASHRKCATLAARDAELEIDVFGADGASIAHARTSLTRRIALTGASRVAVHVDERFPVAGRYTLEVLEQRPIRDEDHRRLAAQRTFLEGCALLRDQSDASTHAA